MKKISNKKTKKYIKAEEEKLLERAENLSKKMKKITKEAEARLSQIEKEVDSSIARIEGILADLDKAEREAEVQLDRLILQEAEFLAEEERE